MHTPENDPIVAEIRRVREESLAKFGYDMDLLDEEVKRRAKELRARYEFRDEAPAPQTAESAAGPLRAT